MTRPVRKQRANGVENSPVAADALAAQPAIDAVAASLASRNTTSSVSNRLA